MKDTELSRILLSLFDLSIANLTDPELELWKMACEVMERKARPAAKRRDWKSAHSDVMAEISRRRVTAATAH
jgi:hypothetical protein